MLLSFFAFLSGLYLCYHMNFFSQHTACLLEINAFGLLNYFSPWLFFWFWVFFLWLGFYFPLLIMYCRNIHTHSSNLILSHHERYSYRSIPLPISTSGDIKKNVKIWIIIISSRKVNREIKCNDQWHVLQDAATEILASVWNSGIDESFLIDMWLCLFQPGLKIYERLNKPENGSSGKIW